MRLAWDRPVRFHAVLSHLHNPIYIIPANRGEPDDPVRRQADTLGTFKFCIAKVSGTEPEHRDQIIGTLHQMLEIFCKRQRLSRS